MALPTVVAKNLTGTPIELPSLGLTVPAFPDVITLTDFATYYEVSSEDELHTRIAAGDIVINDGTGDLTSQEALGFLDATGNLNGPINPSADTLFKLKDGSGRHTVATNITVDASDNMNLGAGNLTTTGAITAGLLDVGTLTVGGSTLALDDLADVDTTSVSPSLHDRLRWDGTNWVPLKYTQSTTNPTPSDDSTLGYEVGSRWINLTTGSSFLCVNATAGAAVWASPGGTDDHSALQASSLVWTSSAHTGIAGSLATFTTGGVASLVTGSVGGDLLFFDGSDWVVLPPGTQGFVLTSGGSGSTPTWTDPTLIIRRFFSTPFIDEKDKPYIEVKSSSYQAVGMLLWPGSSNVDTPTDILVSVYLKKATSMDVRVVDVTNATTIVELTGINDTSYPGVGSDFTAVNLGAISNLSTSEAVWEVQVRGSGNKKKVRISALSVVWS